MNDAKQTTLEDRVQDLEKEVNKMIELMWVLEAKVDDLTLAQRKEDKFKDNPTDIKLKINIDTTEAIQQLQRIQRALQTQKEEE